jgi:hypothetical protein
MQGTHFEQVSLENLKKILEAKITPAKETSEPTVAEQGTNAEVGHSGAKQARRGN